MNTLHNQLMSILKLHTSPGESPVIRLMEILGLGKEAAYRRLRGEIQLSLNEAVTMARSMGVSLDNIIEGKGQNKYSFHITPFRITPDLEEYYYTLMGVIQSYRFVSSDPQCHTYIAGKILSSVFYFKYPFFTRYAIFKWLYVMQRPTNFARFDQVEVSPRFMEICPELRRAAMGVPTTMILNDFLFTTVARDLEYFHAIDLLTTAQVEELKADMLMMIDDLEQAARKGCYPTGTKIWMYVTDCYLDISYNYVAGNGFEACGVGVYGLNFLSCLNPAVIADHKAWIESLISHSTLITGSNEARRIVFFETQRETIRNIKI